MIKKEDFITYCDSIIPQEEKDKYKSKTLKMWIVLIFVLLVEFLIALGIYQNWMPIVFIISVIAIISVTRKMIYTAAVLVIPNQVRRFTMLVL